MNMERDVDMMVTGQRHPFKFDYKVGFTGEGKFSALDVRLWNNAGCSFDLSMAILERAVLHIDNTYRFPNIRIRGRLCKTHLPSNTGLFSSFEWFPIMNNHPFFSFSWFWWTTRSVLL